MARRSLVLGTLVALIVGLLAPNPAAAESDGLWDYHPITLNGTYTPLVGQFGGDDATDILWYGTGTLPDSLWIGAAGARGAAAFTKTDLTINGAYKPVVGDFAGDGFSDILWYTPGAAADPMWVSADVPGGYFDTSRSYAINGSYSHVVPLVDYRENTKDDLFFYAAGATTDYLYDFNDGGTGAVTIAAKPVNAAYSHVLHGDWSGDGREDLLFYAAGGTPDYRWTRAAGTTFTSKTYMVNAAYTPVVMYSQPNDDIFWWASGSGGEVYWRGSALSFETGPTTRLNDVGVAYSGGLEMAVVVAPRARDFVFLGELVRDFYFLTQGTHDQPEGVYPVVGDFDDDGYVDYLWYGKGSRPDDLWYSDAAASRAVRDAPTAPKVAPAGHR